MMMNLLYGVLVLAQFFQPFGYGPNVGYTIPGLYYYCEKPAGYYPRVPECPTGWCAAPAPICLSPRGQFPTVRSCPTGWQPPVCYSAYPR